MGWMGKIIAMTTAEGLQVIHIAVAYTRSHA
jgi:hypothetical protein